MSGVKVKTDDTEIRAIYRNMFETYNQRLRNYARHILTNDDEAADVVEDVFFELWQNRARIDFSGNIPGYLYQATSTRSLNALRNKGTSPVRIDLLESIDAVRIEYLTTTDSNSQPIEQSELRRQIDAAIAELPEKCREVFKLSYIHGLRNRDIADAMNISVRTVDAHMYKALHFLREKLRYLLTILVYIAFFSS